MKTQLSIFKGFFLKGVEYYRYNGIFYVDNGTTRQEISIRQYRMMKIRRQQLTAN